MAYVDINELTRWLAEHCALNENEPPRYARIRAGKARRNAEAIWRKDTGGADPRALAQEISERHGKLGKGERAWLEVLARESGGQRPVIDTLPLGEAPELDDGERPSGGGVGLDDLENVSPMGLMALSTQSLLAQLATSEARNRALEEKLYEVQMKYVEVASKGCADAALLDWYQQNPQQGGDDYIAALREIAPVLQEIAPGVNSWLSKGGKPAPPPPEGTTEDPDTRCERLLTDFEGLWSEAPGALLDHPARLLRLQALGNQIGQAFEARQRTGGAS